jgi:hypothetical protein
VVRYHERKEALRPRQKAYREMPEVRTRQRAHSARQYEQIKADPLRSAAVRHAAMLRRYRLSAEQFEVMRAAHGGRCACCGATDARRLVVDHDHVTGAVRGMVCDGCNTALGALGDDATGVRRALMYLEKPDSAGIGAGLLY